MRKFLFVPLALGVLIACNSGDKASEAKKEDTPAANDLSANPDYQKGLKLLGQYDCTTCHAVEDKVSGPAYREVANKYAGSDTAVAYLAKKIITGGSGVWGTAFMNAHTDMPQEDAEALAKYVLLLKK